MPYQHIVAMIRNDTVEQLLMDLRGYGVPGVSLSPTSGFGEYANPFNGLGLVTSTRVELFIDDNHVENVVTIIMRACSTGTTGDGIVTIMPVNDLRRIRDLSDVPHDNG